MNLHMKISKDQTERVSSVLKQVRTDWRIAWVHQGILTGKDLETKSELWFAHTDKDIPGCAQSQYLLSQMEDFVRQVIVLLLEHERTK